MVAHVRPPYVSPEEYLRLEAEAETKNEYVDGVIIAMSGASRAHIRITRNTIVSLEPHIRRATCEGFGSDLRVRLDRSNRYYYPDYTVACGEALFETVSGVDSLLNPTLIIEVLSDFTEQRDRGEKLLAYFQIETLQGYLLIHQDQPIVEVYTRGDAADKWQFETFKGLDTELHVPLLECHVKLAALYQDVELEPQAS